VTKPRTQPARTKLIAIVGGSGSGKTWLATKLAQALGPRATRLSLDDFYRDRSHLSPARRARLNFDHPRAVDWVALENVLRRLRSGHSARVPCYDFATHCRLPRTRTLAPSPILLLDGLWLLRRPLLRRWFALSIFVDCPRRARLRRRLARDRRGRARSRASVLEQFRATVEPMHRRFVEPQKRRAVLVVRSPCGARQLQRILAAIDNPPPQRTI
jgi:uridine kinase